MSRARKKDRLDKLLENAAEVKIGGEVFLLKFPSQEAAASIQAHLSIPVEERDKAGKWANELYALCLNATVQDVEPRTPDEWQHACFTLKAIDGSPPDSVYGALLSAALKVCGLKSVVEKADERAEAAIKTADEQVEEALGPTPS